MDLGQGLQYSGDGSGAGGDAGQYWVNPHQPRLTFDGADVHMEAGPTETIVFQGSGDGFKALYFVRAVLIFDDEAGTYTVTETDGRQKTFSQSGLLQRTLDAHGNEAVYSYLFDKVVSVVAGTGANSIGYFYTYNPSGLLETVTMRVGGITPASDYRKTTYSYTPSLELERAFLAELKGGVWSEIEVTYFRYHLRSGQKIRFVLGDHAYEQMQAVNPNWPESATDAEVAQYADAEYVDYDYAGRVMMAKTHGGKYEYGFVYEQSSHYGSSTDVWTSKTIVSNPDGSTDTLYYNKGLSLLLKMVTAPRAGGGTDVWYPICQRFDANSRIILSASSSAIAAVDESSPTLFTLKPDEGVIQVFAYDSHGNKIMEGLKKGDGGTVVKQREITYLAHTVAGVTIYHQKAVTEYRDATDSAASNPVTTSFDYDWHERDGAETFQIKTMTTTLPAVPESENGDGQTGTQEVTYDQYGFVTEQADAMGTKTESSYYFDTGALQQTIEDAGAGRLNLTTDYDVDPLGRTVLMKGPEHIISLDGVATAIRRATWTQHLDSDDEIRTIQGYVKSSDGSEVTVNPIQIQRNFVVDPEVTGGRMTETIAVAYAGSGVPPASTVFARSDYVRWSTEHYTRENELTHSRLYHLIPASGLGSNGTNYAQTDSAYDSAGRLFQVTSPEGTIQRTVFNAMGWPMQGLVGTSEGNLAVTALQEYDGGADQGDGNLTSVTLKVDDSAGHDRVQDFSYDWRNRRTISSASDGTRVILATNTYDNRGNVTQADEYHTEVAAENLLNRAGSFFDGRNRLYRTQRYGVDIADDGALKPALTSETYYDQAGRAVRQTPAGKVGFSVSHYDALGRVVASFHAFGPVPDEDLPPEDISTSTVLTQSGFTYDAAGNPIATDTRQRFDDATGDGALGDPATEPKARVSYAAAYPDALGRTQAAADSGTNGGAAWTRPDTIPSRSDTVLVTSFVFDDAGDQTESTDPMGTMTRQEYDQAGRRVTVIENSHPGTGVGRDINKTTRFAYNLDGNLTQLTAENPTTGDQVTEWVYGVTVAQGSEVESKGLVYQKVYPDSTGTTDRVTYTYNRQGQVIALVDQAGTAHGYAFDKFGRVTEDAVTAFGTGIEDTVRKITRGYEVRGMLENVSSLGTGSTLLNQVRLTYNPYSQLSQDAQAHSGAVSSGTLKVGYSYADGSDNTVRPTGITYPDGTTTITTAYDGTDADALSRPDALKEGGTTLCSYRYLGSSVAISVKYDAASNVEQTFRDGGTGDAGDPYTGVDRFGRLIETLWKQGTTDKVRSKYGRNRFGGVVWRRDGEAHAQGVDTEDNYYSYDGLYQVKERQRGDLTGTAPDYTGIANLQQEEDWTYDATGNWAAYSDTSPANAQTRTHNAVNEITQIDASAGNVNPAYDPAGNMLTLPKNPGLSTEQYDLTWDAWNRLVFVKDGDLVLDGNSYDGLHRRLWTVKSGEGRRNFYYSDQWRAVEERVDEAVIPVDCQYTWGLRDRWDLLRRKRSVSGTLDETFFVLRDYFDPVAIVDETGDVLERYAYDAFGNVRFLAPDYISRSASAFDWNFLFHAEFLDRNTSLYNYGYRYYSTGLGRWLSRDPIAEDGGANLYKFSLNSPPAFMDFLGMEPVSGAPGSGPKPISRTDFEKSLQQPLSETQQRLLDFGCIGLTLCQQGPDPDTGITPKSPEQYPRTNCYLTEPEADQAQNRCRKGTCPVVFSKQGEYTRGEPKKNRDGTIPNDSVTGIPAGHFNYVTRLNHGGGQYRYAWMNHQKNLNEAQMFYFDDKAPDFVQYPKKIWCVSCKPCQK
jgi:RHS repeat-associated protein